MRNRDKTTETESESSVFDRFRGGSDDDIADTDSQAGSGKSSRFDRLRRGYSKDDTADTDSQVGSGKSSRIGRFRRGSKDDNMDTDSQAGSGKSSRLDRFRGGSEDDIADTDSQTESGSLFGRARAKYGLGVVLAAIGVVLVVIPEPATSAAGFGLILVGALIWLVGLLR